MSGLRLRPRELREQEEAERLAPAAARAAESKGREHPQPEDPFRTAYERDRDRILHSKAFRRLKHKTQVFLSPDGDHFVTRMTHTIQVAQVGRSLAAALGLNEALTEAICLGHDLGHSPFGHTGEDELDSIVPGGWQHAIHGVRVVSLLEPLNLTWEVRDGIRQSSWRNDPPPSTQEGWACRYADRIAYLAHDVQDALRAGVLDGRAIPASLLETFGTPGRDWIDSMVTAVIRASAGAGHVTMDPPRLAAMHQLRDFMFEQVYLRPQARAQAAKAGRVIRDLVGWYRAHPDQVPASHRVAGDDHLRAAVDYVAGMSDHYAMRQHDQHFRPAGLY